MSWVAILLVCPRPVPDDVKMTGQIKIDFFYGKRGEQWLKMKPNTFRKIIFCTVLGSDAG